MGDDRQLFKTMRGDPLRANPPRYDSPRNQRAPHQCFGMLPNRTTGRSEGKDDNPDGHPDPR